MILLDQVVQVLRGSESGSAGQQASVLYLTHRAMGGGITVQGKRPWHSALAFDRFLEEGLGCRHVSPGTVPEINGLSGTVDRTVKVVPLASNFHVSLVDPPGRARRKAKTIPAFDEFR